MLDPSSNNGPPWCSRCSDPEPPEALNATNSDLHSAIAGLGLTCKRWAAAGRGDHWSRACVLFPPVVTFRFCRT